MCTHNLRPTGQGYRLASASGKHQVISTNTFLSTTGRYVRLSSVLDTQGTHSGSPPISTLVTIIIPETIAKKGRHSARSASWGCLSRLLQFWVRILTFSHGFNLSVMLEELFKRKGTHDLICSRLEPQSESMNVSWTRFVLNNFFTVSF